jgi:hypothetical protein
MKTQKILHLTTGDKFLPEFIELVNDNFEEVEHTFLILRSRKNFYIQPHFNIIFLDEKKNYYLKYKTILAELKKSEKIILHGMFNVNLILFLATHFHFLKKCMWIIWGGDLYVQYGNRSKVLECVLNTFRRWIIKRLGAIISFLDDDYAYAKEYFGAKCPHIKSFVYMSNVFSGERVEGRLGRLKILVGNSATTSNNHAEAFKIVSSKFSNKDIIVYVPLSYGDQKYADEVVRLGREVFGKSFYPLLDFFPKDKYESLQNQIDIAIFCHDRQQAMGNTIQLLGKGKTVYMKHYVSQFSEFEKMGINVHDLRHFSNEQISEEIAEKNSVLVKDYFSKDSLVSQLQTIFEFKLS